MTTEDKQQIHFLECSSPYGSNLKCADENHSLVIWKVNGKEKPLFPGPLHLDRYEVYSSFLGSNGNNLIQHFKLNRFHKGPILVGEKGYVKKL